MVRRRVAATIFTLGFAVCCGPKSFTAPDIVAPNNRATGSMGATVRATGSLFLDFPNANGTLWNSGADNLYAQYTTGSKSLLGVSGSDAQGWTVEFQITKPIVGEQTLTYTNGGYCKLADPTRVWDTRMTGFIATVTLFALTNDHASGMFSCSVIAPAGSGYSGGASLVNGNFDVSY